MCLALFATVGPQCVAYELLSVLWYRWCPYIRQVCAHIPMFVTRCCHGLTSVSTAISHKMVSFQKLVGSASANCPRVCSAWLHNHVILTQQDQAATMAFLRMLLPADCSASGQTVTCTPTSNISISGSLTYTITVKASVAQTYSLAASVAASREVNTTNNGALPVSVTITRTCQHYDSTSAAYQCPTMFALTTVAANLSSTSPDQATCCVSAGTRVTICPWQSLWHLSIYDMLSLNQQQGNQPASSYCHTTSCGVCHLVLIAPNHHIRVDAS